MPIVAGHGSSLRIEVDTYEDDEQCPPEVVGTPLVDLTYVTCFPSFLFSSQEVMGISRISEHGKILLHTLLLDAHETSRTFPPLLRGMVHLSYEKEEQHYGRTL